MAIENYAKASGVGIGLAREYGGWITSFSIRLRSPKFSDVEVFFSSDFVFSCPTLKEKGQEKPQDILVVYDGERQCWREYLTGKEIGVRGQARCNGLCYDLDSKYDRASLYDHLTACNFIGMKEDEFAARLDRYSEKELRSMAEQLNGMFAAAEEWKKAFDRTVARVRAEMERKEKDGDLAGPRIAAGFGAYASAGKQASPAKAFPSSTESQQLTWIRQGRCSRCGGPLRGLFNKRCADCGFEKDY